MGVLCGQEIEVARPANATHRGGVALRLSLGLSFYRRGKG